MKEIIMTDKNPQGLLLCPWCRGDAKSYRDVGYKWRVECANIYMKCPALVRVDVSFQDSKLEFDDAVQEAREKAEAAWNARPATAPTDEAREKVLEALNRHIKLVKFLGLCSFKPGSCEMQDVENIKSFLLSTPPAISEVTLAQIEKIIFGDWEAWRIRGAIRGAIDRLASAFPNGLRIVKEAEDKKGGA